MQIDPEENEFDQRELERWAITRLIGLTLSRVLEGELIIQGQSPSNGHTDSHARQPLSNRETEVAHLIARGHTNIEIGARLGISVKTVETHRARLMEKLGLGNRAALVR